MTPREIAKNALADAISAGDVDTAIARLEQAIIDAVGEEREKFADRLRIYRHNRAEIIRLRVEAEREACAKIAESYVKALRTMPVDSNWIAEEIRARSTASDRSAEPAEK